MFALDQGKFEALPKCFVQDVRVEEVLLTGSFQSNLDRSELGMNVKDFLGNLSRGGASGPGMEDEDEGRGTVAGDDESGTSARTASIFAATGWVKDRRKDGPTLPEGR